MQKNLWLGDFILSRTKKFKIFLIQILCMKKNLVNKKQGLEPIHQKYKANENTITHNPKKKQKQTCKDLIQKEPMITK